MTHQVRIPYSEERDATAEWVARVDRGDQCPTCAARYGIVKTKALGIDLFLCTRCQQTWYDWVTQPSL